MFGYSNLHQQEILAFNRKLYKKVLEEENIVEVSNLIKYLLSKNKGKKEIPEIFGAMPLNSDLFIVCGASDVVAEKMGDEYLRKISGVRRPKTICEKISYFFNGTGIVEGEGDYSLNEEEIKNAKSLLSSMKKLYEDKSKAPNFMPWN